MSVNQYTNLRTAEPQSPQAEQVTVTPSGSLGVLPRDKYKLLLHKLGVNEVALGVASCLLWLATIIAAAAAPPRCYESFHGLRSCYARRFSLTYVSAGIWCGVFLFVSGSLGICTRKNASVCMYNANMAMSIITAVMMLVLIIMSSLAAAVDAYDYPVIKILHSLLAVVALAAMIVCIVHSAYCCAGVCCRNKQHYGSVMYSAQPQQYVQLPNGQLMLVQSQPVMMMSTPGNFQPTQVPGVVMPVTMMPHGAGSSYPMNMPGAMPVTAIPSQPAEANATQMKQQEAEGQFYPSNPPSYDEHNN